MRVYVLIVDNGIAEGFTAPYGVFSDELKAERARDLMTEEARKKALILEYVIDELPF